MAQNPGENAEFAEKAELRGERHSSDDEIDWSLTTFEGLRRKQRQEFAALSFEEKLERVEQMGDLVEIFEARRKARNQKAAPEVPLPQNHPSPP